MLIKKEKMYDASQKFQRKCTVTYTHTFFFLIILYEQSTKRETETSHKHAKWNKICAKHGQNVTELYAYNYIKVTHTISSKIHETGIYIFL